MRKICIINQKGGVGKTTTTVNLAAGLAMKDKKVLILDLDPQGNISTSFCAASEKNMYHILVEDVNPYECIINVAENLDIITSDKRLAQAELVLAGMPSRETVLRRRLADLHGYDYVLIDCPPTINLLNQNALLYANEAFIPVVTDYLSIDALRKMEATINELNELFDHNLMISTIIPTMYDKRVRSNIMNLAEIKKGFRDRVAEPIRINSKLREAPASGVNIFEFAKYSNGAKDYLKLVDKVLKSEFY